MKPSSSMPPQPVIDVSSAAQLVAIDSTSNHPGEDEGTDEAQSGEAQSGKAQSGEATDHDHEGHEHEGHDHEHADHDHHHDMSMDPHFWLDPARMANAATLVGDKLAEADPTNAETYKANAQALNKELTSLGATSSRRPRPARLRPRHRAHRLRLPRRPHRPDPGGHLGPRPRLFPLARATRRD